MIEMFPISHLEMNGNSVNVFFRLNPSLSRIHLRNDIIIVTAFWWLMFDHSNKEKSEFKKQKQKRTQKNAKRKIEFK